MIPRKLSSIRSIFTTRKVGRWKNSIGVISMCPKKFQCLKEQYSLHINCSGNATTIGGINFEEDYKEGGPAHFVPSESSWGFSNTGHFWNVDITSTDYIANNISILGMKNYELYTDACISPLSLTYYGRCFGSGNFTVKLYFSEIMIRGNESVSSLGRRIFDIYIQENLVLKDFNIAEEAKGVDKPLIMNFTAVERIHGTRICTKESFKIQSRCLQFQYCRLGNSCWSEQHEVSSR